MRWHRERIEKRGYNECPQVTCLIRLREIIHRLACQTAWHIHFRTRWFPAGSLRYPSYYIYPQVRSYMIYTPCTLCKERSELNYLRSSLGRCGALSHMLRHIGAGPREIQGYWSGNSAQAGSSFRCSAVHQIFGNRDQQGRSIKAKYTRTANLEITFYIGDRGHLCGHTDVGGASLIFIQRNPGRSSKGTGHMHIQASPRHETENHRTWEHVGL